MTHSDISLSEPYFYLHHAQIDRMYWIWQNQDLAARQNAIGGTITLDNEPPSRNTTLEDIIEFLIVEKLVKA